MNDYENSICCIDAENETVLLKGTFHYHKTKTDFEYPPDVSDKHQNWWMYEDIPF